jgi:class 3 adenylate cyclase
VHHVWHRAAGECSVLSRLRLALGAPETPAEYKQVTVLFANVVRSMDVAPAVGAERLREILAELVNEIARNVRTARERDVDCPKRQS